MKSERNILYPQGCERCSLVTRFSVDHIPDPVFWISRYGRLLYVNDAFCNILGYAREELLSMTIHDVDPNYPSALWPSHWKELKEQGNLSFESVHKRKDGSCFPVEITINYLEDDGEEYNCAHARDITERKCMEAELRHSRDELELRIKERAEELQKAYDRLVSEIKQRHDAEQQLVQTQKMEAIGTLAGGIAHDFNNMLAIIIGNAELAMDDIEDEGAKRNLTQILNASKRSRDLIKQMLTFSRISEGSRKPINLIALIKETANLLRGSLPSTIRIKADIRTDSGDVAGDPIQIQQVIMNLATNAAHAIGDNPGTLAIRLSQKAFHKGDLLPDSNMRPGRYMKLTVRDTGTGIARDIRKRIFDPFFTTKEPGQGTGMGLAVVFGIVKGHQGTVTVASKMGKGTVFSVFLPLGEEAREEERGAEDSLPRGKESVLVVDDEPAVIEMTLEILKRLGYQVTAAKNGSDGWKRFQRDPGLFDLVITDHVMPELTGLRLAERMLQVRNDLPIILCTGYSDMVSPDKAKATGISAFLMKPLVRQELAVVVRRVLDSK